MHYNCRYAKQMIKSHPKMMARILSKIQPERSYRKWLNTCKKKPVEAMGVLIHGLIAINRDLNGYKRR